MYIYIYIHIYVGMCMYVCIYIYIYHFFLSECDLAQYATLRRLVWWLYIYVYR